MIPHGYMTYTGLVVSALGLIGVAVTPEDINAIIAGGLVLFQVGGLVMAAIGRWRVGR